MYEEYVGFDICSRESTWKELLDECNFEENCHCQHIRFSVRAFQHTVSFQEGFKHTNFLFKDAFFLFLLSLYCTKPLSTIQCNKTLCQDQLVPILLIS